LGRGANVGSRTIADVARRGDAERMAGGSIEWLMQWYLDHCDSDWEHSYGVEIGTLDNPGWTLKIDLKDTTLEGRPFAKVAHGEPTGDLDEWKRTGSWWVADVKDGVFEAACGPLDLSATISLFRKWAEAAPQA
jgi:hypothetical protein